MNNVGGSPPKKTADKDSVPVHEKMKKEGDRESGHPFLFRPRPEVNARSPSSRRAISLEDGPLHKARYHVVSVGIRSFELPQIDFVDPFCDS
jgi:hypothetical protein